MILYKNLSIKFKLFLVYAAISVIIFLLSYFILYQQIKKHLEETIVEELNITNRSVTDMIKTTAKVSVKNHLRAVAKHNKEIIEGIYLKYKKNEISESFAKKEVVKILSTQKVGKTGYIYCINSKGYVVVHPKEKVRGQELSHLGFIRKQLAQKQGYIEYFWRNPDEKSKRAKALYMTYFKPWDWIISVSSYKSEFKNLVSIDDFKKQIVSHKFGKSGYSFVLDSMGNALIHPEFKGNMSGIKDGNGICIIQKMMEKKNGKIYYSWKNPNENRFRDKIVIFSYIKEFDWIIASSSYQEEIYEPLLEIRDLFILILIASVLITGIVTLIVSSTLTKPLVSLINHFDKGITDNFSKPAFFEPDRKDEIGLFALSLNKFMKKLDSNRNELVLEIKTRKEVENQLRLFKKVFENVSEGISITDENGNIEAVNYAFTAITGYESDEVVGENPRILKSDRHDDDFYKNMWDSLKSTGQWSGEIWNRRKSGEAYPELLSINRIKDHGSEDKKYVAVFRDISDMKIKEEEIERLAYHDPLTLLPNRALLKDRLRKAITIAGRKNEMILILFLDLDNFKKVNDSIGHHWGDELLKNAAERMSSIVRSGDTVSRLGGDEFIILVPYIKTAVEIATMIKRVQSAFKNPFRLGDNDFKISASIGISLYPDNGDDVDTLIKHADLAMYQSKQAGRDRYSMFEPEMAKLVRERVKLEEGIREALENDEFKVYLQPRVDIKTHKPRGMEALARWIKEDGTLITPDRFIPIAEESGLIVPLGEKIIRDSIYHAKELREKSGEDLKLSVNVSIRQFEDQGFEDMIFKILDETDYPADLLEIEITESLLLSNKKKAMIPLKRLSDIGISIAIDDFGTGYSSLSYIKELPINTIKIDKTFIEDIDENKNNSTLTETIILMGRKLNFNIVAEGVENETQLNALKEFGDMEIQGYFFAKPMAFSDFEKWVLKF